MKSSLSPSVELSFVVVVAASSSAMEVWLSIDSTGHGSEWKVCHCQEEMRRVRVARRVLGRERREDAGVVLLLLLLVVDEEEV